MKALNIKGGLMYTMFSGPRYAYRELVYRKIIAGRAYSTMRVSGDRLLRLLDRALAYAGDTEAPPAEIAETPVNAVPALPPAQTLNPPDETAPPDEGGAGNE
jgi:hypothetical protein